MDPLTQFKDAQKVGWARFAALETHTIASAAKLVRHARISPGQRVLDVACGTGVVAVTAARAGALVAALDLTPELLERARENGATAGVTIDWREGDAEQLPFETGSFDAVVSQFGHMFAPRPEVVTAEMLRVLAPGGTIAFSTWPPELLAGRSFALAGRYMPLLPPGMPAPGQWGVPSIVIDRLGDAVTDIVFDRDVMRIPALSAPHLRQMFERYAGPTRKLVETLETTDPDRLAQFRAEYDAMIVDYMRDNIVRQGFLLTRATKR
jgi:SAM-dependent methyltransferase